MCTLIIDIRFSSISNMAIYPAYALSLTYSKRLANVLIMNVPDE